MCNQSGPWLFSALLGLEGSLLISVGARASETFRHFCGAACLLSWVDDWQAKELAKHPGAPLAHRVGG